MPLDLVVPSVGESISEVRIAQWLKAEGQSVQRDAPVAVLETDKATVELPAPADGILRKILKGPGEDAKVGEVIATVEEGEAEARESAPQGGASAEVSGEPDAPELESGAKTGPRGE